jgi:hypothetical protein
MARQMKAAMPRRAHRGGIDPKIQGNFFATSHPSSAPIFNLFGFCSNSPVQINTCFILYRQNAPNNAKTQAEPMIDALVKAFELANIETLVVSMPEAIVKEASTAVLRKWNCPDEIWHRRSVRPFC